MRALHAPADVEALLRAVVAEVTPPATDKPGPQLRVQPARRDRPGDWSVALPAALAPSAAAMATGLAEHPDLTEVQVVRGGLLIRLSPAALTWVVPELLAQQVPAPGRDRAWPASLRPVALAHARARNVSRAARAHGVRPAAGDTLDQGLTAVVERNEVRVLLVRLAATRQAPSEPARSLLLRESAHAYQDFYARTRTAPRGREPITSTHRTCLALTEATAVALATGLSDLGLDAPEHL